VGVFRCNLDEARFITGVKTIEGAAASLLDLGPALVVITHGAKGCYFQTAKARKHVAGFSVVAKDTTACGDGFMAGLLHGLSQEQADVSTISEEKMVRICQKANAIGALVATTEGAAMSMPTGKVVDRFLMIENY
jgi:fructokinase